jgi:hyperosmotically inducible protein
MKGYFFTFVLGAAAGGLGHWYFTQGDGREQYHEARTNAVRLGEIVRSKASEGYDEVKDELSRTSDAVREKAKSAGAAVASVASDTRITAAVKTRIVSESGLDGLSIGVETTKGVVTLTGDVSSVDQVVKAVNTAMAVDGVVQVVSKLQITAARKAVAETKKP